MSKRAEEFSNKAYPNYSPDGKTQVDMYAYRFACAKGYEQAKKELIHLAQLWVDSGDVNVMSFEQFLKCYEAQSNK